MIDTCHVADHGCERPANLDPDPEERYPRLPECFRCGESVCKNCSSRRLYKHIIKAGAGYKWVTQRVRLCDRCQEEEDGTPWHIVYRSARRAGYSAVQAASHANQYPTPKSVRKSEKKEEKKLNGTFPKIIHCPSCGGTPDRKRWQSRDKTLRMAWCRDCGTHFGVCKRY